MRAIQASSDDPVVKRWAATLDVMTHDWDMIGRIAVAFGLSFAVGFEREVRGGAAGDRTFALVGTAAGAIGVVAAPSARATPSPES